MPRQAGGLFLMVDSDMNPQDPIAVPRAVGIAIVICSIFWVAVYWIIRMIY
jgi:hypothetical protein